jgi:hypothetical protein
LTEVPLEEVSECVEVHNSAVEKTIEFEHKLPTRSNIIRAMHWLLEGARKGDVLWMHYSGHGIQQMVTSLPHRLVIHVAGAVHIPKTGIFSHSDPFVQICVKSTTLKTRTIDNSENPIWNEALDFGVVNMHDTVLIEVYDKDPASKKLIGKTELLVRDFLQIIDERPGLSLVNEKGASIKDCILFAFAHANSFLNVGDENLVPTTAGAVDASVAVTIEAIQPLDYNIKGKLVCDAL